MSSRGVDPWVELRKRRRMDLFDGRINHLFPVAPVVGGASSSDSAFRRVAMFLESCRRARRGRGAVLVPSLTFHFIILLREICVVIHVGCHLDVLLEFFHIALF